ncbi:hypothetical protein W97_08498 [Coniosporium apollinis CBS 100218]|uniref:PHD-type domain-containing protein n=1 Tax=Coniosporium apollinis (strain CBS 100218) TaxID=1168221 RepID=R7Z558_CONA1|nr:uncharacterized protein W97_08498 [Coniosporium apollinis CBS 100218]EON69238.1 hypothetical protein W97_08498 [Coniosporium apollinis CBS 100218]
MARQRRPPSPTRYCTCREPDDHTPMIACDGGCDDWYHTRCVGLEAEDFQRIREYICPKCETETKKTTWLPRCRREGCKRAREPGKGRLFPKYCFGCANEVVERGKEEYVRAVWERGLYWV